MPARDGPHRLPALKYRQISPARERARLIDDAVNAGAEPEEVLPSTTFQPKGIKPGEWVPGGRDQIDPTGKSNTQVG